MGRPYCYLHVVPPSGHPIRETLTGRVSESVAHVDTMRAVVRAANQDALAHLLNMIAGRLRSR
jgi:hypothetical protein